MSEIPDWAGWLLAIVVCAMFLWFFWHTAISIFRSLRGLISTIQHWPEIRRAMTEAEAQSGGRYPFWFRAIRVLLIVSLVAFAAQLIWRKFAGV